MNADTVKEQLLYELGNPRQYITPDCVADFTSIQLAEKVATNTALSNFAVTQALPEIASSSHAGGFLTESLMATIALGDEEAKARINAFLQKRVPKAVRVVDDAP